MATDLQDNGNIKLLVDNDKIKHRYLYGQEKEELKD